MTELTAEQIEKAQTMSLDDLRAMAMKEAEEATVAPKGDPEKLARDAQGRFTSTDDTDNSTVTDEENGEPTRQIFRREIQNGDTIDVYEADSLEDLVAKIAVGKENLNKKLREVIADNKALRATKAQVNTDDEYVIQERFKKAPKQTMKEIVLETLTEQQTAVQRAKDAQEQFVAAHPDYIANPENGNRIVKWAELHGYSELSSEALEKAYQDLSASGLLKLKAKEASADAEENVQTQSQTDSPRTQTTQPRSSQRSSTITTRSGSRPAPVKTQLTEDEAYKMPIEDLKRFANKQLAMLPNSSNNLTHDPMLISLLR